MEDGWRARGDVKQVEISNVRAPAYYLHIIKYQTFRCRPSSLIEFVSLWLQDVASLRSGRTPRRRHCREAALLPPSPGDVWRPSRSGAMYGREHTKMLERAWGRAHVLLAGRQGGVDVGSWKATATDSARKGMGQRTKPSSKAGGLLGIGSIFSVR